MNARLPFLLCALSLLAPFSARAAGELRAAARLELVKGEGTEACISERALERAVEFRLSRRAFRRDLPATLHLRLLLERTRGGWSASLTMHDGSGALLGQRSLATEAAHCSALDESLALVVALLVDAPPSPVVGVGAQEPAQSAPAAALNEPRSPPPNVGGAHSPSSANPAPSVDSQTILLPRDTSAPRQPWRFALSAEGIGALGLLPGVGLGGQVGIAGKAPKFPELRLFAGLYAEREQVRPGLDSGARFSEAHIGLEVCPWNHAFGVVRWFGCAGQSLGRLRVAAFGFDQNTTTNRLTYALLAGTGLGFPIAAALSGRFGVRAEVPLQRGIFNYGARDGSERGLFETKPVTAVLDVGLIVQL